MVGLTVGPVLLSSFLKTSAIRIYSHVVVGLLALIPLALMGIVAGHLLQGLPLVIAVAVMGALLSYPMAALVLGKSELRRLTQNMARMVWNRVE